MISLFGKKYNLNMWNTYDCSPRNTLGFVNTTCLTCGEPIYLLNSKEGGYCPRHGVCFHASFEEYLLDGEYVLTVPWSNKEVILNKIKEALEGIPNIWILVSFFCHGRNFFIQSTMTGLPNTSIETIEFENCPDLLLDDIINLCLSFKDKIDCDCLTRDEDESPKNCPVHFIRYYREEQLVGHVFDYSIDDIWDNNFVENFLPYWKRELLEARLDYDPVGSGSAGGF